MAKLVTNFINFSYEEISVSNAFDLFMRKQKLNNLAPDTIQYYNSNINHFINFIGASTYTYEITKTDIDKFTAIQYDKGLKPTTINTRIRAVRAFLYFCMNNNYMPTYKIQTIKVDEEVPDTYTNKELQILLKKPKSNLWTDLRTWAFINFAVGTGCRLSSILEVKVGDLDFNNKTITIRHTKGRKQLILPMSESLEDAMKYYLKFWNAEDEDILFCNSKKQKLNRSTMEQDVRKYNISRGVMRTSIHSFRHSFARNYILAGGDVTKLQRLLGHSTIQVTMKYVKLYGDDLKQGYENLNPLNNILHNKLD